MASAQRLPHVDARRRAERAAQTRLAVSYERALVVNLARAIVSLGADIARRVRSDGPRVELPSARPAIERVLVPSIRTVAREFGNRLIASPKAAHAFETKAFEDLDAAISQYLTTHTAERVVQISEALREQIRRIIEDGLERNLGQEEIAAAIVEATSGEIAMHRARRIARTEVHSAANAGQQAAAEASPLQFVKEWLSTEDARTRKTHADANGQRVPLDGVFHVGTVYLRYPGDPAGPPGEIINCRCTVLYEPVDAAVEREPFKWPPEPRPPAEPPTIDESISVEDVLGDPETLAAWLRELGRQRVTPDDVVVYADGSLLGLPRGERALAGMIGQEVDITAARGGTLGLRPSPEDLGQGWDKPLRSVAVLRIVIPKGTPADVGAMSVGEVRIRGAEVVIRITGVEPSQSFGDVLERSGIDEPQMPDIGPMPPLWRLAERTAWNAQRDQYLAELANFRARSEAPVVIVEAVVIRPRPATEV